MGESGSLQQQHSSVKEEEKCEVAASQPNSSHERSGGNVSNDCHNVQSGHDETSSSQQNEEHEQVLTLLL